MNIRKSLEVTPYPLDGDARYFKGLCVRGGGSSRRLRVLGGSGSGYYGAYVEYLFIKKRAPELLHV